MEIISRAIKRKIKFTKTCSYCEAIDSSLTIQCDCSLHLYCSDECKEQHKQDHYTECIINQGQVQFVKD